MVQNPDTSAQTIHPKNCTCQSSLLPRLKKRLINLLGVPVSKSVHKALDLLELIQKDDAVGGLALTQKIGNPTI